jgi:hypothetical protein
MSKIALASNAAGTGTFTIASPNSNSDRTLNLQDLAGQIVVGNSALASIATKQIIAVHSGADSAAYSVTSQTNAAFGGTVTITPASANSSLLVIAMVFGYIVQTGTDNDASALLTVCNRESGGGYSSGWLVASPNLGGTNYGPTTPGGYGSATVFKALTASTDRYEGNLVIRHWGAVGADGTSGFAARLDANNLSVIAVEYI